MFQEGDWLVPGFRFSCSRIFLMNYCCYTTMFLLFQEKKFKVPLLPWKSQKVFFLYPLIRPYSLYCLTVSSILFTCTIPWYPFWGWTVLPNNQYDFLFSHSFFPSFLITSTNKFSTELKWLIFKNSKSISNWSK